MVPFTCVHELMGICDLYMAFEGHLFFGMYMGIICFFSHDAAMTPLYF